MMTYLHQGGLQRVEEGISHHQEEDEAMMMETYLHQDGEALIKGATSLHQERIQSHPKG